jgi:2,6-dihydroxypseudooxynicotine hydrolase
VREVNTSRDLAHADPIVQEVLDTWLPRFLQGGIAIGDLVATLRRIGTWDDWGREWMETASVHERLARNAEVQGRRAAATTHWEDAARCHHLAYFLSVRDRALHDTGLERMLACHDRARPGMRPAVEKVTIEGPEGLRMVGLLSVPSPGAPVIIVLPGLDSTKETRHAARGGWTSRGCAVLSLDGPGQGEASRWSTTRPDYEVAVRAAVDWIERRPDLDASRVGLFGSSLGGYYAPRAAAFEDRITATIANCGPFDWAACWDGLPVVTREAFTHYAGAADDDHARELARAYTLDGVLGRLDRPLMVVHGSEDPLIPWQQGERMAAEAAGPTTFHLVEGGNHGVNNLPYRWMPLAREWMLEHLAGRRG